MKLKLKNRILTTTIVLASVFLLSFCMSKFAAEKYTIVFVQEIVIENGEKTIDNFYGVFPQKKDTITIYKTAADDGKHIEKQYQYTFKKSANNPNSIDFFYKEDNQIPEKIHISFENNNVKINEDVYKVNASYFNYLKQKVATENSIMDIAILAKDGLGDYSQLLEPLTKNWNNLKLDTNFQLLELNTKNKNYQTDSQFFEHKIKYTYDKKGNLISAKSENFNKKKESDNQKFLKYSITKNDERSSSDLELYQNKKTLFDSISVNWEQNSTQKEYAFIKYQTTLKTLKLNKLPKKANDIIPLFKK